MSVANCAIQGIYNILCRNVDTAAGGIAPSEVVLHASAFYRHFGDRLDTLPGDGLDRKVQIVYDGTSKWHSLTSSSTLTRMRTFQVTIRVGYFSGSHVDETMIIMADDEQEIIKALALSANWPECSSGCLNGYVPKTSAVKRIDDTRYVLELALDVQVTG